MDKREPLYILLLLECKLVQSLRKPVRFLKKLKTDLPNDPEIPLIGIYSEKNKNTNLKRYIHPNVQGSIIYNSRDTKETQVSTNRQMDKHTYTQWTIPQP